MNKPRFHFPDVPVIWILVFLNVFAVAFYFLMLNAMGSLGHVNDVLFSSNDAQEYRDYTNWLTQTSDYCNPNRPFLYPLLILISRGIAGVNGIWIMQFLFWLGACNLSFLSVRKVGVSKAWAAVSFLLIATYISSICLTAHALTEITVLFFLSVLTYIFSANLYKLRSPSFGLKVILLCAVLFAIKPFYQIHLILAILIFILVQFKNLIKRPMLFLFLICSLTPALIQYGINKTKHGVWNSDEIGAINLKFYLMNKVDYVVATNDLYQFNYLGDSLYKVRHDRIDKMTMGDVRAYLFQHPMAALKVINDDLKLNIAEGNTYVDPEKHPDLYGRVLKMNGRFYGLHRFMFISLFFFFLLTLRKKKTPFHFWLMALSFISFSILLVTGITFWAGDRLIVPSISIWAVIYPVFISYMIKELFLKENTFIRKKFPSIYFWENKEDH